MGFAKYCVLFAATVLLGVLAKQCSAALIGEAVSGKLSVVKQTVTSVGKAVNQNVLDAKKKFDIKAATGGDGNIIISWANDAIKEVEAFREKNTGTGLFTRSIDILRDGFEHTIKLTADALDEALDLMDGIMSKPITDKQTTLNELKNGMDRVRQSMFGSGAPAHGSLGAAKKDIDIADKGKYKEAIDQMQETGTGLFDILDAIEFYIGQALKTNNSAVTKKCLSAAHADIRSAASVNNINLVSGIKSAMEYLSSANLSTIQKHDPIENLIAEKTKAAAAADDDTKAALNALNKEFNMAIKIGIKDSVPILNEIKEGLEEYIRYTALCVASCYEALSEAKVLAKTDSQAAIVLIEKIFKIANDILIEGSIKAYEVFGSAGVKSGLLDIFLEAIEIIERSRVEGTKGFDTAATVAKRSIMSGEGAVDKGLDAAHKMIEANEAILFHYIHKATDLVFKVYNIGIKHGH